MAQARLENLFKSTSCAYPTNHVPLSTMRSRPIASQPFTHPTGKEEALLPETKDDLEVILAEARNGGSGGGGFKRPRLPGLLRTASTATIGSSNNGEQSVLPASSSCEQQAQPGVAPIPPPSFTLTTGPHLSQRAVPALLEVCGFVRVHSKPLSLTPFPLVHLLSALTEAAAAASAPSEGAMDVVGMDGSSTSIGGSGSGSNGLKREFSGVPGPLPLPGSGGRKGGSGGRAFPADVGAPPPFFLARCCLAFLRLALARHAATGEQAVEADGEEGPPQPPVQVRIRGFGTDKDVVREMEVYKWALVRYGWGELLNPLTLPELLRRYLGWRARERRIALRGADALPPFKDEATGFCPFGESFDGTDALVAAGAEALASAEGGVGALGPEGMLAVMRSLCEDAQELRAVQDFVASKVEVSFVWAWRVVVSCGSAASFHGT